MPELIQFLKVYRRKRFRGLINEYCRPGIHFEEVECLGNGCTREPLNESDKRQSQQSNA